jgi:hypothetical protein
MARESKRKRDEKRFGSPQRLVDKILGGILHPAVSSWARNPEWRNAVPRLRESYRDKVAGSVVVDASNVADYYYSFCEKSLWDCVDDFPSCRPPFPLMFLEFARPKFYRDEKGVMPFDPSFFDAWGWVVESLEAASLPRSTGNPNLDRELAPMLDLEGVHSIVRMTLAYEQHGHLVAGIITYFLPIDEQGRPLAPHKFSAITMAGDDAARAMDVCVNTGQLAHTAYLAMSFMNCKNVTISAVEPDRRLNRERERHGHEPFVRYHTINIEPMKQVLRAEGDVESNGLIKALHICRGHFATYGDDKPLFGKPGLAGRFWVPAHTRGSLKAGLVVSDYDVAAPRSSR